MRREQPIYSYIQHVPNCLTTHTRAKLVFWGEGGREQGGREREGAGEGLELCVWCAEREIMARQCYRNIQTEREIYTYNARGYNCWMSRNITVSSVTVIETARLQ